MARIRATSEQFNLMLKFLESHSDLLRPPVGLQEKIRSDRLWEELSELLNSARRDAKPRSADKWRRVLTDWKSKTRKKAILEDTNGPNKVLKPRERRLLQLLRNCSETGKEAVSEEDLEVEETVKQQPSSPVLEFELPAVHQTPTSTTIPTASPVPKASSVFKLVRILPVKQEPSAQRRHLRAGKIRQTFDRTSNATDFMRIENARLRSDARRDQLLMELLRDRNDIERRRLDVEKERADTEKSRLLHEIELKQSIDRLNSILDQLVQNVST